MDMKSKTVLFEHAFTTSNIKVQLRGLANQLYEYQDVEYPKVCRKLIGVTANEKELMDIIKELNLYFEYTNWVEDKKNHAKAFADSLKVKTA